jgi:hypothetical protein
MSQDNVSPPVLPVPPLEYDRNYMDQLNRILRFYFTSLQNPGPMRATTLTLTDLPTSATGLPAGSLWNDSGTIKIV